MPADTTESQTIQIAADLDLAAARDVHARLSERLTELDPRQPVQLELGDGRPTAAALQLAQATRLALRARGATVALGPNALDALGNSQPDG